LRLERVECRKRRQHRREGLCPLDEPRESRHQSGEQHEQHQQVRRRHREHGAGDVHRDGQRQRRADGGFLPEAGISTDRREVDLADRRGQPLERRMLAIDGAVALGGLQAAEVIADGGEQSRARGRHVFARFVCVGHPASEHQRNGAAGEQDQRRNLRRHAQRDRDVDQRDHRHHREIDEIVRRGPDVIQLTGEHLRERRHAAAGDELPLGAPDRRIQTHAKHGFGLLAHQRTQHRLPALQQTLDDSDRDIHREDEAERRCQAHGAEGRGERVAHAAAAGRPRVDTDKLQQGDEEHEADAFDDREAQHHDHGQRGLPRRGGYQRLNEPADGAQVRPAEHQAVLAAGRSASIAHSSIA
jgi:hypothetical protein